MILFANRAARKRRGVTLVRIQYHPPGLPRTRPGHVRPGLGRSWIPAPARRRREAPGPPGAGPRRDSADLLGEWGRATVPPVPASDGHPACSVSRDRVVGIDPDSVIMLMDWPDGGNAEGCASA